MKKVLSMIYSEWSAGKKSERKRQRCPLARSQQCKAKLDESKRS